MKKALFLALGFPMLLSSCSQVTEPEPYGLIPSDRQLEWYDREVFAFLHYGLNTYEEMVNEGQGMASPALFNPTNLDCGQWMRTLKSAGIPLAIITAKHADGFCLWPSQYTDYCVKNSPWKDGKGDVIREFTDSCAKYGIKAGIYLGPHDRHQHLDPNYTTQAYEESYANQLEELMSNYGKVWETWWDGAGADELTTPLYAHWYQIVRKYQPDCVIFGTKNSYRFGDVHWNGNESGIAGDPCWATIDSMSICQEGDHNEQLNHGEVDGNAYIPAESDVSIRPSWFYHTQEDSLVKNVKQLFDIYCTSVGHNSVLLLNLPPDRRGLISSIDSLAVTQLRQCIDETFTNNLLKGSKVTTDNCRGGKYGAENLIDEDTKNYYAGEDSVKQAVITFDMPSAQTFDCLSIGEAIDKGERVLKWSVEYSTDGKTWTPVPNATDKQSIGHKWIIRFPELTASHVRLNILDAKACPVLRSFGVYKQSALAF